MGLLDKFKFWHKDETGLGELELGDTKLDTPKETLPTFAESMNMQGASVGSPLGPMSGPNSMEKQRAYSFEQDLKLLSSKIDTLIAKMDNMNQRIANLERIAEEAQR